MTHPSVTEVHPDLTACAENGRVTPGRDPREVPSLRTVVLVIAGTLSVAAIAVSVLDLMPWRPAHMSVAMSMSYSLVVLAWILQWTIALQIRVRRMTTTAQRALVRQDRIENDLRDMRANLCAKGRAIQIIEHQLGLPPGTVDAIAASSEPSRGPTQKG